MLTETESAVKVDVEVEVLDVVVVEVVVLVELPPYVTLKLVPSLDGEEGCARTDPLLVTIVISCTDDPKEFIAPVIPPKVA